MNKGNLNIFGSILFASVGCLQSIGMKPLFRYIFIVFIFANSACQNINKEKPFIDPEPSMYMVYVRFAADSVTQFVIAESYDNETASMRGKPGACQDLLLGTLPYKHVSKEYYVVDWKWGYFLYKPSNVILNLTWYDLKDWNYVWRLDEKEYKINHCLWNTVLYIGKKLMSI